MPGYTSGAREEIEIETISMTWSLASAPDSAAACMGLSRSAMALGSVAGVPGNHQPGRLPGLWLDMGGRAASATAGVGGVHVERAREQRKTAMSRGGG